MYALQLRRDGWFNEYEHQPSAVADDIFNRRQGLLATIDPLEGIGFDTVRELEKSLQAMPRAGGFDVPKVKKNGYQYFLYVRESKQDNSVCIGTLIQYPLD